MKLPYAAFAKKKLVNFYREQFYIRKCFTYSMLNTARRTQDIEVILKMELFLQDLHRQIQQLHSQANDWPQSVVCRDQSMLNIEFENIKKE
ncbi:unnamed protein product [Rotaria sp. Silwood1]|nr:unnamed protein product [Rotaria sp. Silwood1]CAF1479877.1 unnamed protein product [Rotaria sp. Silwood1]CAF3683998.1 unnamed protein product [Rotaria sp. Silwood1]CAF4947065.1 unnamed protein product [Rotaria sp. Silwood1]